jgi:predicted Zn-dependent protease
MKWQYALIVLALGPGAAGPACSKAPAAPAGPAATNEVRGASEVETLIQEGNRLMRDKKWKEATESLIKAITLDPSNEVVRFSLGTAYLKVGRFKDAEAIFMALQKQFPENPAVKNNLGWLYAKATDPTLKNPTKAIRYVQDAILAAPGDPNIWGTLAEGYYAAGRYDRALRLADAALRLAASNREEDLSEFEELFQRCRIAAGASDKADKAGKSDTSDLSD